MIKLKTLLEIQLITEALPLSVARDYVSIQRNPKIKVQMNGIMDFLKKQPNVIISKNGSRIAMPLQVEAENVGVYNSTELLDFDDKLRSLLYCANKYVSTPFPVYHHDQIPSGKFVDQYGRELKPAKYIQLIVSTFYKNEPVNTITTDPYDHEGGNWNVFYQTILKLRKKYDVIPNISDRIKQLVLDLLKQYDSIVEVQEFRANKPRQYYIMFSTHAYDIAGMSTGRGWGSCMNLYDSTSGKHYVQQDIEQGTIISYLVSQGDLNIQKPIARILIKPYINTEDPNSVLYDADAEYGSAPKLYFETVVSLIDQAQPGKTGQFNLVGGLYCDDSTRGNEYTINR
jgi:hypothetical protein